MCGLFGLIHHDGEAVRRALSIGTAALAHRGPDDCGEEIIPFGRGFVGLGHRRLSIVDLSPLGHQPMVHQASGCRIIFNGEIYNFRRLRDELRGDGEVFKGTSDTEVLLAGLTRYGANFLERLEGMYAFAFIDPRSASLMLARDPAGIKPLYVAQTSGTLLFSSETRSILATGLIKPKVDPRGLAGYLAYGAVQHPTTIFQGILSLPPGSCLTIGVRPDGRWGESGDLKTTWCLPPTRTEISEKEALHGIRVTLDMAVKNHLLADVPVSLFLSSGLDSTVLGALAARHSSQSMKRPNLHWTITSSPAMSRDSPHPVRRCP